MEYPVKSYILWIGLSNLGILKVGAWEGRKKLINRRSECTVFACAIKGTIFSWACKCLIQISLSTSYKWGHNFLVFYRFLAHHRCRQYFKQFRNISSWYVLFPFFVFWYNYCVAARRNKMWIRTESIIELVAFVQYFYLIDIAKILNSPRTCKKRCAKNAPNFTLLGLFFIKLSKYCHL